MHPQSPTNNFTKFALNLLRNDSPITQNINRLTPKLQLYRSYGEPQSLELIQEPVKFLPTTQVVQVVPFQIHKHIKKQKIITNNLVQKVIKLTCKCLKSKCLKQYCECYASGRHCSEDCNCQDCSNQKGTPTPLHQSKQTFGCNCKKTACAKRYCECYLKGQRCTFLCNCIDCCNQDDDSEDSQSSKENVDISKNYGELGSNLLQNAELFRKIGL